MTSTVPRETVRRSEAAIRPPETNTPGKRPWPIQGAYWLAMVSTVTAITSNLLELIAGLRGTTSIAHVKDLLIAISFIITFVFFAQMMRTGRRWGRTTLAVFAGIGFGFNTLGMLQIAGRPITTLDQVILSHISNVTAVVGVILMYVPASNLFFAQAGEKAQLISQRLRKAVLATHIIVSLAWMGIIAAMEAMTVMGTLTTDHQTQVSVFAMDSLLDSIYLGLVSLFAVLTGVVCATGTKWGLLQRKWVVVKFAATTVVMSLGFGVNHQLIMQANKLLENGATPAEVSRIGWWLTIFGAQGVILLTMSAVISTYKPWGLTKRGRRLQAIAAMERPKRRSAATLDAAIILDDEGAH